MTRLQVVVGGQYGSEGKGAVTARLAAGQPDLLAVRVAGPNAGHTVIGRCPPLCQETKALEVRSHSPDVHPWRLRHVPVAAVTNLDACLYLAPGSEIDPDVLLREVRELDAAGYKVSNRLTVAPTATVITAVHRARESEGRVGGKENTLVGRIGSTGKGVGAARAARAMRTAPLVTDHLALDRFVAGRIDIQDFLQCGGSVLIEGTQGYGLGQHAGHYPYVTSSDCTAIDFLAMAGVSPWLVMPKELAVWVVFRAYPIRVAGNSGPLYAETTWADLGLPEEKTTVTNRLRRVGHWNPVLARSAMEANGWPAPAVKVAFTMADHLLPELAGHTSLNDVSQETKLGLAKLLETTEHDLGAQISLLGTGPASVIDLASLRSESTP